MNVLLRRNSKICKFKIFYKFIIIYLYKYYMQMTSPSIVSYFMDAEIKWNSSLVGHDQLLRDKLFNGKLLSF